MAVSSYSSLKSCVADWLDRDDIGDAIDAMIDMTEADINRRLRLTDMESAFSVTISGGVAALPSDFLEAAYLYVDSSPTSQLQFRPTAWLLTNYPNRTSDGKPCFAAVSGSNLIFGPYPDDNYTILGQYYARPTALSATNETNFLTTKHPDLLLYGALLHSAPYLGDDERLPIWQLKYKEAMASAASEEDFKLHPRHTPLVMRA